MAHDNDKSTALADVYAESFLTAAREQGQEDAVAEEFADLVRYMDSDPAFEQFLVAKSVDDDPRRASLEKLFRGRMSELLLNLLQVLNNRGRCDLVRRVQRCVALRMQAKRDQQEVVVETAMPLTDALRQAITERIGQQIGKEVLLIEEVNPELIGGVMIRCGDVQIDGSIASQVRRTHQRLIERATEEIHAGRDYVAEA